MIAREVSFKRCTTLACLMLVFAGCGSSGQTATISGSVVCDGTPLPEGLVVFSSESATCSGKIQDGKYLVSYKGKESVPLGECVVTVFPPVGEVEYNAETNSEEPVPSDLDLDLFPGKYQNKATSDLKFSLHSGKNEFDILLNKD